MGIQTWTEEELRNAGMDVVFPTNVSKQELERLIETRLEKNGFLGFREQCFYCISPKGILTMVQTG
jgi:hypothetical protein